MTDAFDPVAVFAELERRRVAYVAIGAIAGVLRGTGEQTRETTICPNMDDRNMERLAAVLTTLGAKTTAVEPTVLLDTDDQRVHRFSTASGIVVLEPYPEGTNGWDDLRRRADYLKVASDGTKARVADAEDLMRILTEHPLDTDRELLARYHRVAAIERSLDLGIGL